MIKKENKLFVIITLVLTFILFISLGSGKLFESQIDELENDTNSENIQDESTVQINWEEIYPYNETIDIPETVVSEESDEKTSIFTKLVGIATDFGEIGESWSTLIYEYNDISKTGFLINSKLTDPSIGQTYTKLKNGYWISNHSTKLTYEEAEGRLINYSYLQDYLENKGIDFLYVYAPSKLCAYDNELPDGTVDYINENIDVYISALDNLGINYTDLRENIHEDGLDHYSLFFKTDHHWTTLGGYWAASTIENELNDRFSLNITNIKDIGTFTTKTYENAMFGSAGQAMTHLNEESEDFDLLLPDFENNFTLIIPDKDVNVTGSFEEIFINYEALNEAIDEGGGYVYESILYGNRPYVKIINNNNPDGPKILMIRDSYSIAVAPYLAFSCSELIMIDTRTKNGNFTGSIINCINQEDPDIVLSLQCGAQYITLNK